MIISCPECAGPFEVPDEQIAALVQVQCPHCAFRMILDFAAANDPGLVEQGMKMASGFRSAADYRASAQPTTGEAITPAPAPDDAIEAAPTPAPDDAITSTPAAAQAVTPAPAEPVPEPEVAAAAASPSPAPAPEREEEIPVRVTAPVQEVPAAPSRTEDPDDAVQTTIITPMERPVVRTPPPSEPARPAQSQPAAAARGPGDAAVAVAGDLAATADAAPVPFGDGFDEDAPTMIVSASEARRRAEQQAEDTDEPTTVIAARAAAPAAAAAAAAPVGEDDETPSGRLPPHTPPGRAKTSISSDDEEVSARRRPLGEQEADGERKRRQPRLDSLDNFGPQQTEGETMSTWGIVVLLLLLLVAGGLVAGSLALEDTPDPRPLIEKLYRKYLQ